MIYFHLEIIDAFLYNYLLDSLFLVIFYSLFLGHISFFILLIWDWILCIVSLHYLDLSICMGLDAMHAFSVCSCGRLMPAPLSDCTFIQCLCICLGVLFLLLFSAFIDTCSISNLDFNLALLLVGYRKLDFFPPLGSLSKWIWFGNKLSFPPVFVVLSYNC